MLAQSKYKLQHSCFGYPDTELETRYSQECFCGNAVQNDGSLVDTAECNMPCSGSLPWISPQLDDDNYADRFQETLPKLVGLLIA